MKIKEIWFDGEHIYGRDEEGKEYSQSLLWYPNFVWPMMSSVVNTLLD